MWMQNTKIQLHQYEKHFKSIANLQKELGLSYVYAWNNLWNMDNNSHKYVYYGFLFIFLPLNHQHVDD